MNVVLLTFYLVFKYDFLAFRMFSHKYLTIIIKKGRYLLIKIQVPLGYMQPCCSLDASKGVEI